MREIACGDCVISVLLEIKPLPGKNAELTKDKSNKKNTLQTIVDKCLFYGKVGIEEGQGIMKRECLGFG